MNMNFFKVRVFHTLKMFSGLKKLIPVLLTKKKKKKGKSLDLELN